MISSSGSVPPNSVHAVPAGTGCKLAMHRAPFICDAKYRAGAVDSPPNGPVRPRSRSFVRRLVLPREKENVKRTQSSEVATQKRLRKNAGSATTMNAEAKFLGVEAAEARPRKSSGNSLQDMLSHRFGGSSGTEKKRSSKKQSPSRTRSAKPPGLTLDRLERLLGVAKVGMGPTFLMRRK